MRCDQNSADKISRYKALVHKPLTGPRASPTDITIPTKPAASPAVGLPLDSRVIHSRSRSGGTCMHLGRFPAVFLWMRYESASGYIPLDDAGCC